MTILVDTSVWVDHFHAPDQHLLALLRQAEVTIHPYVVGELAMGSFRDRTRSLRLLLNLPSAEIVDQHVLLDFIDSMALVSSGLSFVDAHLLASAAAAGITLWTRDKRLRDRAQALGCCAAEV